MTSGDLDHRIVLNEADHGDDGSSFIARITDKKITSYTVNNSNRSITANYTITYNIVNLSGSTVCSGKKIEDSATIRF